MICTYYDVLIELVVSEILDPETACNFLTLCPQIVTTYVLDVLWGQPIKLIQVASNSELPQNQWNNHIFFEIVPSHCFGPQNLKN